MVKYVVFDVEARVKGISGRFGRIRADGGGRVFQKYRIACRTIWRYKYAEICQWLLLEIEKAVIGALS